MNDFLCALVVSPVTSAPACRAIWIAITPTPPVAHSISTRSPPRTRAISNTASCAVKQATGSAAPAARSNAAGSLNTCSDGIVTVDA